MANRWPPWIEARVAQTADVAITAAGEVALTGATFTVVSKVATRLMVVATFEIRCDLWTAITGSVRGLLRVAGVTLATPYAGWRATVVNELVTLTMAWTVDVAAGVSTAIELRANLTGTMDNDYTFLAESTGFVLLGMPSEGVSY
jgi:hypothetical protein